MRRVLVIGCPGAGKTTFARCLSEKLALPLIHLDVHYWRPGWQPSNLDDWRTQAAKLADAPEWIMDGNFPDTFDIRMPRADSLVWLDYPRTTCLARVLLRRTKDGSRVRADLPTGCEEDSTRASLHPLGFPVTVPETSKRRALGTISA